MTNLPMRWVCKECGKPRRKHGCLSCGSLKPLTNEKPISVFTK